MKAPKEVWACIKDLEERYTDATWYKRRWMVCTLCAHNIGGTTPNEQCAGPVKYRRVDREER
jgi:hypothetical protein